MTDAEKIATLRAALPDPDKLKILAGFVDASWPNDANPEVQTDLRRWAARITEALAATTPPASGAGSDRS